LLEIGFYVRQNLISSNLFSVSPSTSVVNPFLLFHI